MCLVDQGDLAGGTSQASSKLVHGGLRYLEHYEFRLVREALAEREVMLQRAPHIVWPMRFVLPEAGGVRSRFAIKMGLFLYDHLAPRRRIPASSALDLATDPSGRALRPDLVHGFAYWDCWVDDSRLVVLNARLAAGKGASVRTRTRVIALDPGAEAWTVSLQTSHRQETCRARAPSSTAAGPWAATVAALPAAPPPMPPLKLALVKGSHIVVPRIPGGGDAFLFQNTDGRVVFVLPFETDFTLIGTTDVPVGSPSEAVCTPDEETYLLAAANRFLAHPLTRATTSSGVSPVCGPFRLARPRQSFGIEPRLSHRDVGSSRRRSLAHDRRRQGDDLPPPRESRAATSSTNVPRLAAALDRHRALTAATSPTATWISTSKGLAPPLQLAPRSDAPRPRAPPRTLVPTVIGDARRIEDMGPEIAPGLTAREVRYLAKNEWAASAEDILWRRTKAGLHLATAEARTKATAAIESLLHS